MGDFHQRRPMTSRYRKPFRYPDGFADVLRDFTREVLREQPKSIPDFGAAYFENLLRQGAEMQQDMEGGAAPTRMSPEELQEFLADIFIEADRDKSGTLSYKEFKEVIQTSRLGFSKQEIRRMLMEADENEDGYIDYNEFLPIGVDIVQAIFARREAEAAAQADQDAAQEAARIALVHGMDKDQYKQMLLSYFRAHDVDNSGFLSRKEFKECMKNADLGLTRQEINALMAEIDVDGDDNISLEEFDSIFFEMLVEIVSLAALEEARNSDELTTYLLEIFRGADLQGQGLLHKQDLLDLLRRGDFGLTKVQVLAVLSEAQMDEHGFIQYEALAPFAANMIKSIWEQNKDLERADKMAALYQESSEDMLFGRPKADVLEEIMAIFAAYDADGNGTLDPQEFKNCLNETGLLGRPLNNKEVQTVMLGIDENDDGKVDYEEFLNFTLEILNYYYQEERMGGMN